MNDMTQLYPGWTALFILLIFLLLIIKIFSLFTPQEHDLCYLCYYLVYSFKEDDYFSDFPVNIRVASFMVSAFHGSTIIQSGIYLIGEII